MKRRDREPPPRFEYLVRDCRELTGQDLEDRLNALEPDGWEPALVVDWFLVLRRERASRDDT